MTLQKGKEWRRNIVIDLVPDLGRGLGMVIFGAILTVLAVFLLIVLLVCGLLFWIADFAIWVWRGLRAVNAWANARQKGLLERKARDAAAKAAAKIKAGEEAAAAAAAKEAEEAAKQANELNKRLGAFDWHGPRNAEWRTELRALAALAGDEPVAMAALTAMATGAGFDLETELGGGGAP